MAELRDIRVAAIATDGVEEPELLKPLEALRESGAQVTLLSVCPGEIQCFNHHDKGAKVPVEGLVSEAKPEDYDALLLPGGALNADALRVDKDVKRFVRSVENDRKAIAFICHAPWVLISSCLVRGRTLTSFHSIEDDIRNAGGHWVDHEVTIDFNWVSSRKPADIPAFNREMLRSFAEFSRQTQTAR